jgi:RNA polymerase sigma-70 factor (ECF subfamily)
MLAELTDLALWNAVKEDDIQAFDVLFNRYWSKVFTSAFNRLRDRNACIEITNDIFVMLWMKRDKLDIQSFEGYLQTVTRNRVYKHFKTLKSFPVDYEEHMENVPVQRYAAAVDYDLRYAELEKSVEYYLRQLPQRCREIFLMSRKDQLNNDEIASRLSISKRTVENQLTTALKHLRVELKRIIMISALFLEQYF